MCGTGKDMTISLFLSPLTQVDDDWELMNEATYWLGILKEGLVHSIHSGKVGHVSQEDTNPDHVLQA